MADAGLGVVTEALLNTVLSLAAEEIGLACGLKKELTKLAHKLEMVQALLSDAQSKQGNNQAVQLWLKRLQSVALDAQIVLDEFGYQVLRQKIVSRKRDKVRSFFSSSNPVLFRFKLAHKVKDVMSSLQQAESDQIGLKAVELKNLLPDPKENRSTSPFVEDSEIVSRDDDTPKVIDMLIGSAYHEDLPVMTILGMGGLGKTTLAQLVYKNDKVTRHFDKRVWVCVSDDFNVQRLLAEMLQSLTNSNSQLTNTEALVSELKEVLGGKRYLLVLDDVWNKNKNEWDCMRGCLLEIGGSKGSKILATTREEDVAAAMRTSGYHRLQVLSKKQSWELFEKTAFAAGGATKTQQLVDIGERILERCGGVPLAIKAIGGLLYSKHFQSEWEMIETSRVWSDFSGEGKRVLSIIKLSYDQLPSLSLKQCFAYCAIFGKDTWMEKDMLIQLWMAQGLLNPPKGSDLQMEDVGSEYYNILLRSSLLQDAERDYLKNNGIRLCKMHDLVHDVSLQVSENYCFHVKDWRQVRNEIETVHLSITAGEREMWKRLKGIVPSKLRTLHLKGRNVLKEDLSANFRCLSVLIVEDEFEMELPNWIGKMKHLRFLDISRTQIGRLPNSFMELYYLQTLRINSLVELPRGFSQKLLNLRHLIVKTAIQHWLEAIDPRHRYGHNLHFYYVRWLHSQSKEPFFYWLDTGEGKEVNLVEKCPRWKLQQQCIKYLGPIERKAYEVAVEDGKLLYQQTREFLDTTAEPKAKWIFVLSTTRTMYVGKEKKGTFQHTSFLAGGATIAAGRLVVEKGILKALWPDSGRYRPTQENFLYFISFLKENNVDLNGVELDSVGHTTHEV